MITRVEAIRRWEVVANGSSGEYHSCMIKRGGRSDGLGLYI